MLQNRPYTADMYRGGNAFGYSDFQSCFVHVNRKSESLAIKYGTKSFEYELYKEMTKIYHYTKMVASIVEAIAETPQSICDMDQAIKKIPGLDEFMESNKVTIQKRLKRVEQAYRNNANISGKDSRKYADTLGCASKYLTTFIRHPGMAGSINDCERFIRKYIIRSRNMQRTL